MTTYNFALKIETSLPKSVIRPAISETRKAYDILVYLSFIYSFLNENV